MKSYLIAPLGLLAAFLLYEHNYSRERTATLARVASQLEATRAIETARLAERRQIAAADVLARNEARDKDERDRVEQRRQAQAAAFQEIERQTAEHLATAATIDANSATLEHELAALHTQQATLGREAAELRRQLEVRRAARRATELELQESTAKLAAQLHAQVEALGPVFGRE